MSAGVRAKARNAAAVVISKNVIGSPPIGALAFVQHREQRVLVDQLAGEADALVEAHEVRRGIDVDAIAGRFEAGAHRRDRRALAVGAGDMDDRRQLSCGLPSAASSRSTRPSVRSIFFGCSRISRVRTRSLAVCG